MKRLSICHRRSSDARQGLQTKHRSQTAHIRRTHSELIIITRNLRSLFVKASRHIGFRTTVMLIFDSLHCGGDMNAAPWYWIIIDHWWDEMSFIWPVSELLDAVLPRAAVDGGLNYQREFRQHYRIRGSSAKNNLKLGHCLKNTKKTIFLARNVVLNI